MLECKEECIFNSNNECWLVCKNKFYQQGRADAIDEVYDILKKEYYYGFRTPNDSKQKLVDMIVNGFFNKLKQLKEQNK